MTVSWKRRSVGRSVAESQNPLYLNRSEAEEKAHVSLCLPPVLALPLVKDSPVSDLELPPTTAAQLPKPPNTRPTFQDHPPHYLTSLSQDGISAQNVRHQYS